MDRASKEELVSDLRSIFDTTSSIVVTHYTGLTVAEAEDLRKQVREAGANFRVTKNRLTRLALKGTKFEGLKDLFNGPTAVAFSDDPVAAAKVVVNYAKENDKLVVIGGAMEKQSLDVDDVKSLAALPSLNELRGKLVGLLNAPATNLVGVLQAPAGQLARVLSARGNQNLIA